MGLRPQRTCRFTPLQGTQSRPGTRAREFRERKKLELKKPPAPVPMGPGPGEPSLQGRRQKGKSLGSGAEGEWESAAATHLGCCVSFQTFFKLSTSARLLRRRRGRGAGPQQSSGVLSAARGEPGRLPAPPTCRGPGKRGPV